MSYRNHEAFLATAEASIAAAATATNGTEFTSKSLPPDPNQALITVIFTTAGGDGGSVDFEFQASYDGGTTWTTTDFIKISVASDEDADSNVVRHSTIVDTAGVSRLRLWKVKNGDGVTAITSVNAVLSWGHMY